MSHEEKLDIQSGKAGGWSPMLPIKDAAEMIEMKGFLDQVKEAAQKKAGRVFPALDPLECASQVVAGMNYRIMAFTGDGWNSDFEIFQPPGDSPVTLTSYSQTRI